MERSKRLVFMEEGWVCVEEMMNSPHDKDNYLNLYRIGILFQILTERELFYLYSVRIRTWLTS